MQNKVSVKELNEFLKNGELSEFGTFSEVDIVFIAGLFLLYMQNRDNWIKIPQLFTIEENDNAWNHSHYFKQIYDLYGIKHDLIFDKFPNAYSSAANPVSRFFVPPIYITNIFIDYFFGTLKPNTQINDLKEKYIKFFAILDFIDKTNNNYKKFAQKFEKYEKEILQKLNDIAPVFVFIFIVSCKRLAKKEERTFEETKDFVEKIWQFTQTYTNALHELARNIVEHSGRGGNNGQGMITIRAYSGTSSDMKIKVLETHVFDYGKKGIYGTLLQNTERNKTDSKNDIYSLDFSVLDDKENKYTIKDFIEPTDNKKFLLQQFFREMAHYGLMSFKSLIERHKGKIIASSVRNDNKYKRETYIFPENDDTGNEIENYDIEKGTSYYFELPFIPSLFEREQKNIEELGNQLEVPALSVFKNIELVEHDDIKSLQPDNEKKYIINFKLSDSLKKTGFDKIDNRETENDVCNDIIDKLNSSDVKKIMNYCIALDFDGVPINKSNLLRILAKLSREKSYDFIVYNISCDVFIGLVKDNEQFFERIKDKKDYINDKKIETSYWLKDKSILFFSKYEKVQENEEEQRGKSAKDYFYFADFLFGETPEDFNTINAIISNTFPNVTYINKENKFEINESFSIPEKIQSQFFYDTSKYLLPFDTLLRSDHRELFLYNVNTILQNNLLGRDPYKRIEDYVSNVEGYHIKHTHFKIGNKVHSSDFYYAKQFFQNSFYTIRLAMYMAKQLSNEINNPQKKITLIGYEMYSELILSLIENFLKEIYKYPNVDHFVAKNEDEKLIFLPKDAFGDYLCDCKDRRTIIIVPIAATGNTVKKLETEIQKHYMEIMSGSIDSGLFISYNIILAQDTDQKFNVIKNNSKYHPIISLPAVWYSPRNCQLCYGIDENGKPVETRPLYVTDNSSLTPSLIFGNPVGKIISKSGNEVKNNLVEFSELNFDKSLNYQKVTRNDYYRIYDIDSDIFIRDNELKIKEWLINIVKNFLEGTCNLKPTDRVVIVAPCHESNSKFFNLVNKNVFSSAATIIHHQSGVDYIENFSLLNIKRFEDKKTKFFYVDDSIITGKHFFEFFDLLKEANDDPQPLTATILLNDQSIPLIHEQAVKLSGNYFAFASFNQLPTFNIFNKRPLEHEFKRYYSLQESVLHDALRRHFYLKAQNLNPEKRQYEEKETPEKQKRHLKMFKITHEIYNYFTETQNSSNLIYEEDWNKFVSFIFRNEKDNFEINREDTNIKALFKVLSQYPFVLYNELRNATTKWLKEQLSRIVLITDDEKCFDINKDYDEYDKKFGYDNNLSTFKFHLRRAVLLDNYQVLEKDFFKKLLMWFCKIDKYFEQNMDEEINKKEDELHNTVLFDRNEYKEKIEKKIENLRDFPIFVLANYVEMIQKNGWVAYQILKNIKKINFSRSYSGKQFLIMLEIESASVIDDFVKMINKEKKFLWRNMYKEQDKFYTDTNLISNFFNKKNDLLETNKYELVKETFLNEYNDLKNKNTPFLDYLWIKQLIYGDCIDKETQIKSDYQTEIDEIIKKMKRFFSNEDIVQAFFIVTDGKQEPHVLSSKDKSMLNELSYEFNGNKQLKDIKSKSPIQTLIDFLKGESYKKENVPNTTAEFVIDNDKWINLYDKDDNRNLEFIPNNYKWLYLIRISELKETINKKFEFEAQGLLGFYSTEDLRKSVLPKQLLMLLRKDMSEFIRKHHKNDEFADLIQQRERNKYVVKINHGVQTYKDTIEYQFEYKYKDNLEDNIKTLLKYLVNKLHIISKLNSENYGKTELISLNKIEKEFNDTYKFVFSLPMQIWDRIEKEKINSLVQFKIQFDNPDSQYYFPEDSYKDIIFEILLNIRRYGIGNNTFTPNDKMIIDIGVSTSNDNKFLTISNTYKGDLGCFKNLNYDDEPHGIELLKQLWYSHNLGRVDIIPPTKEDKVFRLLIQLKESKDERQP
jgi:hypothetical protein